MKAYLSNFLIKFFLAFSFTYLMFLFLSSLLTVESFSFLSPASCMPHQCFCETIYQNNLKQRSNSISSLCFLFVGFWNLISPNIRLGKNAVESSSNSGISLITIVFATTLFCIGIGSFIFHATLSFVGQFLDVAGMNLLANFILLTHSRFKFKFRDATFLLIYLSLNLVTCFLIWYIPDLRRILFAFILIVSLFVILLISKRRKLFSIGYLYLSLFTQMLALLIWNLDLNRIVCNPDFWIQGHAIWHVLSAGVCYLLYIFYLKNNFGHEIKL